LIDLFTSSSPAFFAVDYGVSLSINELTMSALVVGAGNETVGVTDLLKLDEKWRQRMASAIAV